MPKKAGVLLVIVGAVMIIAAIAFLAFNKNEDDRAGMDAESMLADVLQAIPQKPAAVIPVMPPVYSDVPQSEAQSCPESEPDDAVSEETEQSLPQDVSATPLSPELPVVTLHGYGYVGYVSLPTLGITLPVMSEWDYVRLKSAPCRQFGSSRTDDLVIAAHNYDNHFGRLGDLKPGDDVVFVDMDGMQNDYEVVKTQTVDATDVEAVQNSGFDLVLYTCTYSGTQRVAAFCNRIK